MSQRETSNLQASSPPNAPPPNRAATLGRHVKACSTCRATKIKCKMRNGAPPCERCERRGIDCQIEKTTQSVLEEATKWQNVTSGQVAQLQTAANVLLRLSNLPALTSYNPSSPSSVDQAASKPDDDVNDEAAEDSLPAGPILTPVATEDEGLYSLPINSLYEATRLRSLRDPKPSSRSGVLQDFISRGLISEAVAQRLFARFTSRLDYFCYGILCPHESLEQLRKSSPLLTAAVCTIASYHDKDCSDTCKICHAEYMRLVSGSMFSISHSTDDIRALIAGAYWLGNISYTLLGHAIRIAMRLNHHLAYFKVVENPGQYPEEVHKARLWYTLYIMDHHASILYGRPALISPNEEPHQNWELFIQVNGNCEVDLRMSSQVALYHIVAKVKEIYGGYSVKPVPEHSLPQLRNFFAELDRWYMVWGNRMPRNARVGWFARDGAILHYHFARLHLCSYIFRGMDPASQSTASPQVCDYAAAAITSATSVMELVLERDDIRNALVGMPLYFQGMITFAAVFLIKAARSNFGGLAVVDVPKVTDLIQSYVRELRSHAAARQHLVYHLSNGLEDMMNASSRELAEQDLQEQQSRPENLLLEQQQQQQQQQQVEETMSTMDQMFVMNTFDLLQAPIDAQDLTAMPGQDFSWQSDYDMNQ